MTTVTAKMVRVGTNKAGMSRKRLTLAEQKRLQRLHAFDCGYMLVVARIVAL